MEKSFWPSHIGGVRNDDDRRWRTVWDTRAYDPTHDPGTLMETINEHRTEIVEASLDTDSEEVSTTIAGYIAKKLAKRSNCKKLIANQMDLDENQI